jgi:hypothetical protein
MKKNNYFLLFFLLFFLSSLNLYAKLKIFSWNDYRIRYEYENNFNKKSYGNNPVVGSRNDGFVIGRIRTGIKLNLSKHIDLSFGIQHAAAWDLNLTNNDFYNKIFGLKNNPYKDYLEPFNTYIEIKNLYYNHLSIKIGRQQMYYGNKRVFGPGNWGNTGRWIWDEIRTNYVFKRGFFDAYYGKTVLHQFNKLSLLHRHGYESYGFYSSFKIFDKYKIAIEPFAMTKKDHHNRYIGKNKMRGDLDSYYYGARLFGKNIYNFQFDLTYIKQKGDYSHDDIDAYGYHILLGYHFNNLYFKPFLSGEFTYGSGDDNPKDNKRKTFDGAFGALDKVLGRMNLFKWKNVKDYQVNLELFPLNNLYFKFQWHDFYLAEKKDAWYQNPKYYVDKTGGSGDRVGSEFDIISRYRFLKGKSKGMELQCGYGHFLPGEFTKGVASGVQANWFFFQWRYNFKRMI